MTWYSILKKQIKKGFANFANTNHSDEMLEGRNEYLINLFEVARFLALYQERKFGSIRTVWYNDNLRGEYEDLASTTRIIRNTIRSNPKANKENSNFGRLMKDLDFKLSKFATAASNFYNSKEGKRTLKFIAGRDTARQKKLLDAYNYGLTHIKKALMEGDFEFSDNKLTDGYYSDLMDNPTLILNPESVGDGSGGIRNIVDTFTHEGAHRASNKLNFPYSDEGKTNLFQDETLAYIIENPDKKDRLKRLVNILGRRDILEFVENHPDPQYSRAYNSMVDDYQMLLEEKNKSKRDSKLSSLENVVRNFMEEINTKNDAKFGKSMGWKDTLKAHCMAQKMGTQCSCEQCGNTKKAKYSKKQIEAFDKDGNGIPFEPKDMKLLGKE